MKIDRSATARALAKAIAYHEAGKPREAQAWAAQLVRLLGAAGILDEHRLTSLKDVEVK